MCGGPFRFLPLLSLIAAPAVAHGGVPAVAPPLVGTLFSDDLGFELSTPTLCCDGLLPDAAPRPPSELRALPPDPGSALFVLYALGSLGAWQLSGALKKIALTTARTGHLPDAVHVHTSHGPTEGGFVWVGPAVLSPHGSCIGLARHCDRHGPPTRRHHRPDTPRGPPA